MEYGELICECGFETVYDVDNTWYFKCPCCGNVLVDVVLSDAIIEELEVFDYSKFDNLKNF